MNTAQWDLALGKKQLKFSQVQGFNPKPPIQMPLNFGGT